MMMYRSIASEDKTILFLNALVYQQGIRDSGVFLSHDNKREITGYLDTVAPPEYQESYDNAGLITGSPSWPCTGAIICLDVTEAVIAEAVRKQCNLVIAHHPYHF